MIYIYIHILGPRVGPAPGGIRDPGRVGPGPGLGGDRTRAGGDLDPRQVGPGTRAVRDPGRTRDPDKGRTRAATLRHLGGWAPQGL